jgi:hypothetical protein
MISVLRVGDVSSIVKCRGCALRVRDVNSVVKCHGCELKVGHACSGTDSLTCNSKHHKQH